MSRETKRQLCWYQFDDTEAIARHMERMAGKGWLLEKADNWYFTYRRGEPARVKYTVTFFPEASVFDPGLTEGQETYADYCQAAGWELAAAYGPIQYFRSTRPDPTPIETDEAVKLSAIRRTMRKTAVLSYSLLLVLPLVYLPLFSIQLREPMEFFSRNDKLALLALMAGIALFAAVILLDYLIWVLRSKRSLDRGGVCARPHTRFRLGLTAVMMALCAGVLAVFLLDAPMAGMRPVLVIYLVLYGGIMALGRWVLRKLKGRGTSRGVAKGLYFAFALGAGLAVGFGMLFLFGALRGAGIVHMGREPADTYTKTYEGVSWTITWDIFYDELPVTLEDLGYPVAPEDHCTYEAEISRSPLAVHSEYTQEAYGSDSELPRLRYQTFDTRWSWLLEKCWENLLTEGRESIRALDPAPWGAEEAYREEYQTEYFLRYPDRIVSFYLGGEVRQEQLDIIARALAGY